MTSYAWRWEEGAVDKTLDHLEITFGDVSVTPDYKKWVPVALVSAPNNKRFSVQLFIEANSPEKQKMMDAVRKELNFYLVELSAKGRPDPWNYAQYHCTTASNAYSDVHWSYYKARLADGRHGAEEAGARAANATAGTATWGLTEFMDQFGVDFAMRDAEYVVRPVK